METVNSLLNRNAKLAQLWTYPPVIRAVKMYPYFIFHYHFARLLGENPVCREIWSRTPVLYNYGPRSLGKVLAAPITDADVATVSARKDPLYKLNWRHDKEVAPPGSLLDYLAGTIPTDAPATLA
jgi:hypothetical protein